MRCRVHACVRLGDYLFSRLVVEVVDVDMEVEKEADMEVVLARFSELASDSDFESDGNGADDEVPLEPTSSEETCSPSWRNWELRMKSPRSPTLSPRADFSSRSV